MQFPRKQTTRTRRNRIRSEPQFSAHPHISRFLADEFIADIPPLKFFSFFRGIRDYRNARVFGEISARPCVVFNRSSADRYLITESGKRNGFKRRFGLSLRI